MIVLWSTFNRHALNGYFTPLGKNQNKQVSRGTMNQHHSVLSKTFWEKHFWEQTNKKKFGGMGKNRF